MAYEDRDVINNPSIYAENGCKRIHETLTTFQPSGPKQWIVLCQISSGYWVLSQRPLCRPVLGTKLAETDSIGIGPKVAKPQISAK